MKINKQPFFWVLIFKILTGSLVYAQIQFNPFAPVSPWREGHGTYCQQSTTFHGIEAGDSVIVDTIYLEQPEQSFSPTGSIISQLYPDGITYCAWGCNGKIVYKIICTPTNTTLKTKRLNLLGAGPSGSGYWVMDKNNKNYFLSNYKVVVIKDSILNDPYSNIAADTIIDLTSYSASSSDALWSAKLLYTGELAIVSREGNIFIINRNTWTVYTLNLNENIKNSFAVDENNNLYINTSTGTRKFNWNGSTLYVVWNCAYGNSGSTPTLMGSPNDINENKLVAVTDESNPMNLILIWRDSIPSGWAAIGSWPLRVAAVKPITFNTQFPQLQVAPTQNSLMVDSMSILTMRWDGLFPSSSSYFPGAAKFTWNASNYSITNNWTDTSIFMPNSMQAYSKASNYFYGQTQRFIGNTKYYFIEGFDWNTGVSMFQKQLGPQSNSSLNVRGSGIQLGWYKDLITMSPDMIIRLRKLNLSLTYTFIGNDNYNTASNWQSGIIPPGNLSPGSVIIINPILNGECILNVPQIISRGGKFIVLTGKKITIQGNLIVQ